LIYEAFYVNTEKEEDKKQCKALIMHMVHGMPRVLKEDKKQCKALLSVSISLNPIDTWQTDKILKTFASTKF